MILKRIVFPSMLMIVLVSLFFSSSCKHDPMGISQLDTVCFQTQIFPILQTSCGITGCHDGGGGEGGDFSTQSYQTIMPIVTPCSAAKSTLYQVITAVNGTIMPPKRPLTKDQRTLILVWIEQGANNTTCNP